MTTSKVNWERMFPDEFVDRLNEQPVVFAAYGLAEPHGPYNALGLDYLKAQSIVERAAGEHGGIVAPPFAWHMTELPFHTDPGGWFEQVGIKESLASSLSRDVFYQVLLMQIRAFDARGFHAAILVTGHYGGLQKTMRDVCAFYTSETATPMQLYACADHELITVEGVNADHAGVTETSQLMALHEDLVDLDKPPVSDHLGTSFAGVSFPRERDGAWPSRELGEKIVASQIASLGEKSQQMLDDHEPSSSYKPPTVPEIEKLWLKLQPTLTRPF